MPSERSHVSFRQLRTSRPVFGGGTPVGGSSHITIRQDGSYTFKGHFHDSGAPDFNVALVCAVKDSQNRVYTFQHSGHMSGTFSSGSRDDDFLVDSRHDQVADDWANLGAGATAHFRADTSAELLGITNALVGSIGTVLAVVGIVIAV
jgi:hypothetical protein